MGTVFARRALPASVDRALDFGLGSKLIKFFVEIKMGIRADNNPTVKQLQNDLEKMNV